MKSYIALLCLVFTSFLASAQKVSDLPAASSLSGTEMFSLVQSGSTKKATLSLVWSSMPSLTWSSITGKPTTLSGYGITDPILLSSGSYADPSWITSLSWSKITGRPTSLSGYGITDAWSLSSGGALTGANTISGAFNIGYTNNAIGLGVAPGSILSNVRVDARGSDDLSSSFAFRTSNNSGNTLNITSNDGKLQFGSNGSRPFIGAAVSNVFDNTGTNLFFQSASNTIGFVFNLPSMTANSQNGIRLQGTFTNSSTSSTVFYTALPTITHTGSGNISAYNAQPILNLNSFSGTFKAFGNESNFSPNAGTATYKSFVSEPTINTTGTYSGTLIAYDHSPILTSTTGLTHLAWRNTSGNVLIGATTATASTRVDAVGISGGNILRLADHTNAVKYLFQNSGNLVLTNTEIDIQGSTAGITNTTGQLYLRGRNISGTRSILFGVGSAQSTDASVNWSFGNNTHSDNAAGVTRNWTGLSFVQTVDQSGAGSTVNYIGIDYNPVLTITGTLNHTAQQWRSGNLLVGGSGTAAGKLEVRGNDNSTGDIVLLKNLAGTSRFEVQGNGAVLFSGSAGTSGQVLTSAGSSSPPTWTTISGGANYATTTSVVATDANFTANVKEVIHIPDGILTASRAITIPTGADGDPIEIYNNEDTHVVTLTGATVYLADRTTVVTELLYNVPTLMQKINGLWIVKN